MLLKGESDMHLRKRLDIKKEPNLALEFCGTALLAFVIVYATIVWGILGE